MITDFLIYFSYWLFIFTSSLGLLYLISKIPFWITLIIIAIPMSLYFTYDIISTKNDRGDYDKSRKL